MAISQSAIGGKFATIKHYSLEQVLQITSQTTDEAMEKAYLRAGAEYTRQLAQERIRNRPWMDTVRNHVREIIKESHAERILEMGPGVEDILYQCVMDSDGGKLQWTVLDIIPEVVATIQQKFGGRGYYAAILGNARSISLQVPGLYDLFIGMDTLDSVVAFSGIAGEIKSKGIPWAVHIQDNIPAIEVIASLIKTDTRFREVKTISLVTLGDNLSFLNPLGETSWTHIAVPTGGGLLWMQTNEYLHTRIAEEFSKAGFHRFDSGFKPYPNGDGGDAFLTVNQMLRLLSNRTAQADGLPTECTYHYLIMRLAR
ncbi:hypothetical protein HYV84_05680 [Candidatus Woesearchaeota archaeon]|nr:hypothetical protein [Candidatus Woesearchaeota archaeon]